MRTRRFLALIVAAALTAACGNADDDSGSETPGTTSGTPLTTASAADLSKNVPRPGVAGVTDKEIRVAVITAKTNPIGGRYHEYIDGIRAYFKMINDRGGIYGRQLVVASDRDDVVGTRNLQETTASLADDNAFAMFEATQQLTGLELLVKEKVPTFVWNINVEFPSTPSSDHSNVFGQTPAICFNCPGPLLSWLAMRKGFTKVGILGYGVSAQSKTCASGTRDAYERYTNGRVQVVHYDDTLPFAGDVSASVARMKQAGVQFVNTCMDTNQVLKLQKEMQKQGLNAVQHLPNAYDHNFLRENGALFEGSTLQTFYVPREIEPQSPATQEYYEHIKAITDDPVELTELGWIMAKMFVDGLKGAGPEFTRQKVIDYLNSQRAYSADGLIAAIDWTTGHIDPQRNPEVRVKEQCQPVLEIIDGKFVPFGNPPGRPFLCLDTSKGVDQEPVYRSFAPGGVG
jgi:ABC-type branched-subunit amino acid transport system substrate-binding protein